MGTQKLACPSGTVDMSCPLPSDPTWSINAEGVATWTQPNGLSPSGWDANDITHVDWTVTGGSASVFINDDGGYYLITYQPWIQCEPDM
jgi:hypothetical protein